MGLAYRILARLDVKAPNVIKPVRFDGLRVVGNPVEMAKRYADQGADELLYLDAVASLYGRNTLESLIEETSREVFIPITVAGGVRTPEDARRLLRAGADRVAINSEAIRRRDSIARIANTFGSQAVSVSIEAKRVNGGWEAYTDCGRNPSGREVGKWASEAVSRGAGEILITSIDQDGTRKGPDLDLLASIDVDVPVIYSGGIRLKDVRAVAELSDGMAIGASLHYGDCTIADIKRELRGVVEIR